MKCRCLGADRLKLLTVRSEQLRERVRHLMAAAVATLVVGPAAGAVASPSVEPIPANFPTAPSTISGAITNDMVMSPT